MHAQPNKKRRKLEKPSQLKDENHIAKTESETLSKTSLKTTKSKTVRKKRKRKRSCDKGQPQVMRIAIPALATTAATMPTMDMSNVAMDSAPMQFYGDAQLQWDAQR